MNPQDPLQQLRDIHLPAPVSWWPPAPGWWLLALLSGLVLAVTARWLWRRYMNNAYRRQAAVELESHYRDWRVEKDHRHYIQNVNAILKRCALHCYPTLDTAPMSGASWVSFLDSCWKKTGTTRFANSPLQTAPYMERWDGQDIDSLQQCAMQWIKNHGREPTCSS